MKSTADAWEKFLNPQSLKQNLISASVFLVAYEMLKQALIDQLRGFFTVSMAANGEWEIDEDYRQKVLSLDKKEMIACAKWFRDSGALNDDDLLIIKELADHRNIIAHELPAIIGSQKEVSLIHLRCIYAITSKIDNWWIREIEIPTNPDFDHRTFSEEELSNCCSMRMMIMSLLIEIANGDDTKLSSIYEMWRKHHQTKDSPATQPKTQDSGAD